MKFIMQTGFLDHSKKFESNLSNSNELKINVEDQVKIKFYTNKNFIVDINIDIGNKLFKKRRTETVILFLKNLLFIGT